VSLQTSLSRKATDGSPSACSAVGPPKPCHRCALVSIYFYGRDVVLVAAELPIDPVSDGNHKRTSLFCAA
jgi:hypothetical protein